ncbi:MAG TPA: hypothetical protein VJA47_00965 [archaeon]|nr:hypothetical protein [archaeon]
MFEFLNALPIPGDITVLVLFFVFLIVGVFVFKVVKTILVFAFIGGIFPLVSGYIGYTIEPTFQNIIGFAAIGILVAIGYMIIRWAIKIVR